MVALMNWNGLLDETALASLLAADKRHFAKPVCDGLAVFLEGLPASRQAHLLSQQAILSPAVGISARIGLLARGCPVLQKIGQVLARDQRLSSELRQELRQLESLSPSVPQHTIQKILDKELGSLDKLGIRLAPAAIAEASVAVVIPFTKQTNGTKEHGVFKVLKPDIEKQLEEELQLLERVGIHLDERCDELKIPHLDYQEAFQLVRDKLLGEIRLDEEQDKLRAAQEFYADEDRVQIPSVFDCCTPRITAMQRVWGDKITNHPFTETRDRHRLAKLLIDATIAKPVFAKQRRALFHCDPHAGNIFLTTDGRLALLDWSLVGWLDEQSRAAIVQIMLGAATQDKQRMFEVLNQMSARGHVDQTKMREILKRSLKNIRRGQFPGLTWLLGLLDEIVHDAGLRLAVDLMMFRKSLYTLSGVVAEVGASAEAFDRVLTVRFVQHLVLEWPSRWFTMPYSRNFATHLSNFDLTKAILSSPASVARFWMGQGSDFVDAFRHSQAALTTTFNTARSED